MNSSSLPNDESVSKSSQSSFHSSADVGSSKNVRNVLDESLPEVTVSFNIILKYHLV